MKKLYKCNWCGTEQIKDSSSMEKIENTIYFLGKCCNKDCLYGDKSTIGMEEIEDGKDRDRIQG